MSVQNTTPVFRHNSLRSSRGEENVSVNTNDRGRTWSKNKTLPYYYKDIRVSAQTQNARALITLRARASVPTVYKCLLKTEYVLRNSNWSTLPNKFAHRNILNNIKVPNIRYTRTGMSCCRRRIYQRHLLFCFITYIYIYMSFIKKS